MDKIGEFKRVPDEEDWSIVTYHVEVAIFCVELQCKSTRALLGISSSLLTTYRREAGKDIGTLTYLREEFGPGVFGYK